MQLEYLKREQKKELIKVIIKYIDYFKDRIKAETPIDSIGRQIALSILNDEKTNILDYLKRV